MAQQQFKLMDIARVIIDPRVQSRAEVDENVVDDYAQAMADDAVFPPPVVFTDDGKTCYLAAGFHRVQAMRISGTKATKFDVRSGDIRDAILFSISENQTHGLRRTTADKRRSVEMLLADDIWARWSDREIAKRAGVSHPFVASIRNPEKVEKPAKATPKERPTSKPGVVISDAASTVSDHSQNGNVTTYPQVIHRQNERFDEQQHEDPTQILAAELDKVSTRLALAAAEGYTEEEKVALATQMEDARRSYTALCAERDSIAAQRDEYMRENGELKKEVKRLQKKLDQANKK